MTAQIVRLFKVLYADSWGPRLEYVMRHAVLTAAGCGMSMYDVKLLLLHADNSRQAHLMPGML